MWCVQCLYYFFFFQAEDGIRDGHVTGVQTCALPISLLIGLIVLAMFLAVKKEGMATVTQTISEDFGFGAATSLVIGLFVLGTIISPDIARWAKSKKDAILAAFFGFLIGNSFMLVMAIIL